MALESAWAVEMDYRFQRAATTATVEAGVATDSSIAIPLTAFTDGTNWQDVAGQAGFSDWPPPELMAIALRDEG